MSANFGNKNKAFIAEQSIHLTGPEAMGIN